RWWRSSPRDRAWPAALGIAAAALVPVAVTLDETRVYSLTTAPLLVVIALRLTHELDRGLDPLAVGDSARDGRPFVRRAALAALAVAALVAVPGMFSAGQDYWATDLRPAAFVRFLADGHVP